MPPWPCHDYWVALKAVPRIGEKIKLNRKTLKCIKELNTLRYFSKISWGAYSRQKPSCLSWNNISLAWEQCPNIPGPAPGLKMWATKALKNWVMLSHIQNLSWMPSTGYAFHNLSSFITAMCKVENIILIFQRKKLSLRHVTSLRPNSGEMGLKFKPDSLILTHTFCFLVYTIYPPRVAPKEKTNGSKIHLNCKPTRHHTETWSQDISKNERYSWGD